MTRNEMRTRPIESCKAGRTNGDMITASPEALARWVSTVADCYACPISRKCDGIDDEAAIIPLERCVGLWIDWLNQESEQ